MLFTNDKNHREYESPILIRRDELGIRMVDLCRKCGATPGAIYDLAYGMTWPVYVRSWKVKPWVEKLLDVLDITIEDAFPLVFCKIREHKYPVEEFYIGSWSMMQSDIWSREEDYIYAHDLMHNCNRLKKRERDILRYRFVENETLEEIGRRYGVNMETIRQVEAKALRKLRHPNCRYSEWERFKSGGVDE